MDQFNPSFSSEWKGFIYYFSETGRRLFALSGRMVKTRQFPLTTTEAVSSMASPPFDQYGSGGVQIH